MENVTEIQTMQVSGTNESEILGEEVNFGEGNAQSHNLADA